MGRVQKAVAAVMMVLLVAVLLLTSFQAAIYGDRDYRFYEREYQKYQVADSLDMTIEDIMNVTDHMMAYLIDEEEELSIVTDVDGKTQDFFNEQDRFHMEEVQHLFLGGLKIRNTLVALIVILFALLAAWKAELKKILPRVYLAVLGVSAVVTGVLGGLIASDFNRYFTIFHKIFFDNDLWIFDPATDYMIRMLPEGFFFDFVVRIGTFFVGSLLLLTVISAAALLYEKRNND